MISFKETLNEDTNTHLEHLEDEIINGGVAGAKTAILFLNSLKDMLSGSSTSKLEVTVKWDGAPAVFAGINPENGKFFVATKSLFNKTPKINYTNKDISDNHGSGGPVDKLKVALKHLPELEMKGIFQGDIMFTKEDLEQENIDGVTSLTFTPNTVTYAVPDDSDLASTIRKAKLGVVWHTTYKGKTIADLSASFGVNAKVFKKTKNVWFDDANLDLVNPSMTKSEIKTITGLIAKTKGALKLSGKFLNLLKKESAKKDQFTISALLKVFFNTKIREGLRFTDTKKTVKEFQEYYMSRMVKEMSAKKTDKGKQKFKEYEKEAKKTWKKYAKEIHFTFATYLGINDAKLLIVKQLEKVKGMGTFLRTEDGFKVTAPEGYVAIDSEDGSAVKLVDRLGFSHANFTIAKNWDK
tara:strand:- start:596 stop:1825 length:1230 start_codon:yes stop_codon:yes gene_type:complete